MNELMGYGVAAVRMRLPRPRRPLADELAASRSVLPVDVEERLAEIAGVEPPLNAREATRQEYLDVEPTGELDFARRLLRVAEVVSVGAFLLLVVAALLAAHWHDSTLRVHELPL